jgi:hypothetical protein
MTKSKKQIKSIEITLVGGPCDGVTMEVSYPAWDSYMLNLGRSLYIKKSATVYEYSENTALHRSKTIADILNG